MGTKVPWKMPEEVTGDTKALEAEKEVKIGIDVVTGGAAMVTGGADVVTGAVVVGTNPLPAIMIFTRV